MKEIKITGKLGNIYSFHGDYDLKKGDTVYTHPKEWVELTTDEEAEAMDVCVAYGVEAVVGWVADKLKEKNHDNRN